MSYSYFYLSYSSWIISLTKTCTYGCTWSECIFYWAQVCAKSKWLRISRFYILPNLDWLFYSRRHISRVRSTWYETWYETDNAEHVLLTQERIIFCTDGTDKCSDEPYVKEHRCRATLTDRIKLSLEFKLCTHGAGARNLRHQCSVVTNSILHGFTTM